MVLTPAQKAAETRRKNNEALQRIWTEKAAAKRAAREALQSLLESADATPEQVLEAAKLLTELAK